MAAVLSSSVFFKENKDDNNFERFRIIKIFYCALLYKLKLLLCKLIAFFLIYFS